MLLLFDPTTGAIAGEGQPLMYTLGGAMLVELGTSGHLDVGDRKPLSGRTVRAVGDGPTDPLLREAWEQIARRPAGARALVLAIGPVLRERVLERLIARGEIVRTPHRVLGIFPSHRLTLGDTGARDALLDPVRAALVDGVEPDARTGALAALLSASDALPQLHADIPWSGDVLLRGRALQRGEWGARAAADAVFANQLAQILGVLFVTTVLPHLDND